MCAESATQENHSTVLDVEQEDSIVPASPWRAASVQLLGPYRFAVIFADGLQGQVDMSTLIHSAHAGVFAALRDTALFARIGIEFGAITWPGELDLAPDAMYDAIRKTGAWVL